MRKNQKSFSLLLVAMCLLLFVSPAYAKWYAYYDENNQYGIWATIRTSSSAPYMPPNSGQSHSVTTTGPHWLQTGWKFHYGNGSARQYWEYCAANCENDPAQYRLQELGTQAWNTSVKYEVSHDSVQGAMTWCAWVGGTRRVCNDNIQAAPTRVIAQSEIHTNDKVEISTHFQDVRIMNSAGSWLGPDLSNLHWDFPYKAESTSDDDFRTFRRVTSDIFLPYVAN